MLGKFCVFCGKKPENKNMEHIIPQWLIRRQGIEKQCVPLLSLEGKHISFMQFKFPACTECNTKFATLEGVAKPVLESVLSGKSISGFDAHILMMWFEKVRIGLWLSNIYYHPDLKNAIVPHLFIQDNLVKSDRMLSIRKIQKNENRERLSWYGTNNIMFMLCPYAFGIVIDDYYFLSASHQNMLAEGTGFPRIYKDEDGCLTNCFQSGTGKITTPVLPNFIPNKKSITFYQPIYSDYLRAENRPDVDEYIIKHSYNVNLGIGGVFMQRGDSCNIKYLQPKEKISMKLDPVTMPDDLEQESFRLFASIPISGRVPSYNDFSGAANAFAKIHNNYINGYQK